jgi:uncharacterized membrane protein HdeD (DUF308 family)
MPSSAGRRAGTGDRRGTLSSGLPPHRMSRHSKGMDHVMIVLGIILLVLGFVFAIHLLWIIGIVVLVIGAVLAIAGFAGREIGGRRHWY